MPTPAVPPTSSFFDRASAKTLQWLVWVVVALILFFTYLAGDGWQQSGIYAILNCIFYASLIYGNILLLFPTFYEKGKKITYLFSVIALILTLAVIRGLAYWWVYNTWFAIKAMTLSSAIIPCILSNVFIYILSLIFRISLAWFSLKKQTQEILLQKSTAELNLLKSQVQPHFLFNTLNNIYYEAYREAPVTALLIERLSEIMRYFVDESPRQYVKLSTEIRFLENYMALEQIRVRHGIDISFLKESDPETLVPPMLLMTFVENMFKHGIDKASTANRLDITLRTTASRLTFETRNRIRPMATLHPMAEIPSPNNPISGNIAAGFGIRNLKDRLYLLYGNDFELNTEQEDDHFRAHLSFPLNPIS